MRCPHQYEVHMLCSQLYPRLLYKTVVLATSSLRCISGWKRYSHGLAGLLPPVCTLTGRPHTELSHTHALLFVHRTFVSPLWSVSLSSSCVGSLDGWLSHMKWNIWPTRRIVRSGHPSRVRGHIHEPNHFIRNMVLGSNEVSCAHTHTHICTGVLLSIRKLNVASKLKFDAMRALGLGVTYT